MVRRGFTLIELMIVVAILAVLASIAIPGLLSSQRSAAEKSTGATLRVLSTAEADFRHNDRDGNQIVDYWTGDVAGLRLIVPQQGTGDPPASLSILAAINLIEVPLAAADADFGGDGLRYAANQHVPVADAMGLFVPKAGYWFARLREDRSGGAAAVYGIDTDGPSNPAWGECHNTDRFGFLAVPQYLVNGRSAFLINQDNTIYRFALTSGFTCAVANAGLPLPTSLTISGSGVPEVLSAQAFPDSPGANGWKKLD